MVGEEDAFFTVHGTCRKPAETHRPKKKGSRYAGFLYGYELHGSALGGLKWGVAAGAATAFCEGIATGDQVKAVFPRVGEPHPV